MFNQALPSMPEANYAQDTQENYLHKAAGLARRYAADTGAQWQADPRAFARWVVGLKPTLAKASWRQYKAACVCLLRTQGSADAAAALAAEGNAGCSLEKPRRTSALKQKKLPPGDLNTLTERLMDGGGKWGHLSAAWLRLGVLTGLRPIEWKDAVVEGAMLTVKNAKNSHGRACGDTRCIEISGFSADEMIMLRYFLDALSKVGHAALYSACRQSVQSACMALWPTRATWPSLYSARHQFAADAKASGLSRAEVAALMGHLSEDTASTHYARKRSGRSPLKVAPSGANVAVVLGHSGVRPPKTPSKPQNP